MSLQDDVDRLRQVPLFAGVDLSKLKLFAFAAERLQFNPGQTVFAQGEEGDAAYVILDGTAAVTAETQKGAVTVAELGKHAVMGEIGVLLGVPRTATVTASGALTALRIDKELFLRMVMEYPQIGVEVMRAMALRLEKTTEDLIAARAAQH